MSNIQKPIVDIRYFESKAPNIEGSSPNYVGKIYKLPKSNTFVGARIARKLRELGFSAGPFNHVYINFSTVIPVGKISFSIREVDPYHPWLRYIDVGVDPTVVNALSRSEKLSFLESITLDVAKFLACKDKRQIEIVSEVRKLLKIHGEDLAINHKRKDTKSYSVAVNYKIDSKLNGSTAWIEYRNNKSGEIRSGLATKLQFYEDVFFLVSSIAVKDQVIILKPRDSFKASLYQQPYQVPIMVPIAELTVTS